MEKEIENEKKTLPVVAEPVGNGAEQTHQPATAALAKRLAEAFPDEQADWNDATVAQNFALKLLDSMQQQLDAYKDTEGRLTSLMNHYPEVEGMIRQMMDDENLLPEQAFDTAFGIDSERQQLEQQLQQNLDSSHNTLQQFIAQHGLSAEQAKLLMDNVDRDWNNMLQKKLTEDMLSDYLRLMNYDADIAKARQQGEIDGRNANIKAMLINDEQARRGDGLPQQHSSGYTPKMISGSKPVIDFERIMR